MAVRQVASADSHSAGLATTAPTVRRAWSDSGGTSRRLRPTSWPATPAPAARPSAQAKAGAASTAVLTRLAARAEGRRSVVGAVRRDATAGQPAQHEPGRYARNRLAGSRRDRAQLANRSVGKADLNAAHAGRRAMVREWRM
jgi:hypothetical protein